MDASITINNGNYINNQHNDDEEVANLLTSTMDSNSSANTINTTTNLQIADIHLEGRDAIVLLDRLKIIVPIICIFFIKFIFENMIQFVAIFTCCFVLFQTKAKFTQLLSMKLYTIKAISIFLILTIFGTGVLYTIIKFCGVIEPLWQRLILFSSTDPDLSFLTIIWKCLIVDIYAQLIVVVTQIASCFVYLLYYFNKNANNPDYLHLSSQQDYDDNDENDIESHQGLSGTGTSAGGGISRSPSSFSEIQRRNNDTRHTNRNVEHSNTTPASVPSATTLNTHRNITTSSDVESKYTSEIFLAQKRLCLVVSIIGVSYRTLLPVSVWIRFLQIGFGSKLFPVFYIMWKIVILWIKTMALNEALRFYRTGSLEFGHYCTPEELANAQECPVCFDRVYKPVSLKCKHIFCEHCIYEWLDKEKTCPVCRAEVENESEYLGILKDEMAWSFPIVI